MKERIIAEIINFIQTNNVARYSDVVKITNAYTACLNHHVRNLSAIYLKQLREDGLLEFYIRKKIAPKEIDFKNDSVEIFLTTQALYLQAIFSYNTIMASRYFGPKAQKSIDVFVVMPFAADLSAVYESHVKPSMEKLNYSVERGDEISSHGPVINDIYNSIISAKVIVADCTYMNPNVFYEIGMSHMIGKDVILLSQDISFLPFDLKHIRAIIYDNSKAGLEKLAIELQHLVRSIIGDASPQLIPKKRKQVQS